MVLSILLETVSGKRRTKVSFFEQICGISNAMTQFILMFAFPDGVTDFRCAANAHLIEKPHLLAADFEFFPADARCDL